MAETKSGDGADITHVVFLSRQASANKPREKEMLSRQIAATDESIDRLVYELYGLSEEEIRIVEGKK